MRSYEIASDPADEVKYLREILKNCVRNPTYARMKPRLPPAISPVSISEWAEASEEELAAAISSDPIKPNTCIPKAAIDARFETIDSFFDRFALAVPGYARVHISRYGTGGSYHPLYEHPLARMNLAVTLMDRAAAEEAGKTWLRRRCYPSSLTHEWVHLIIHLPVMKVFDNEQSTKEALVDHLCSCDELKAAFEQPYWRQPPYVDKLPDDWKERVVWWKPGQCPTWCTD